jgi:hypothetical protein
MAINTTAIRSLLRPGLAAVFGDYRDFPAEWTEAFEKHTSDMQQEIEVETKLLGLAQIKAEGASTVYDDMGQRSITNYLHRYVAIGFIITRQAIKDNLYKSAFPLQAKALKSSMAQTKEVLGASIFNNGFSTSYPIGDGKPVYSTTHPIDNGTVAQHLHRPGGSQRDVARTGHHRHRQLQGRRRPPEAVQGHEIAGPQRPAVHRGPHPRLGVSHQHRQQRHLCRLQYGQRAGRLVAQPLLHRHECVVPADRLRWRLQALRNVNPSKTDMYTDPDTQSVKVSAIERYSFGVSNFRGGWGSQGAT